MLYDILIRMNEEADLDCEDSIALQLPGHHAFIASDLFNRRMRFRTRYNRPRTADSDHYIEYYKKLPFYDRLTDMIYSCRVQLLDRRGNFNPMAPSLNE